MNEDLIGSSLGGYRLLSFLGRGAQATVYRARQTSVERDVALKLLSPRYPAAFDFKARFEREARSAASLEHPNVLPVYDYGEQDGRCYIVMRLAERSLSQRRADGPPLELDEIVAIVSGVAGALDCAHARRIVHRDVKPENVLLDSEGRALLADFGIAKLLDDSNLRTQTNLAVGTPNYMSPEQCAGLPLDGRADVYALAAMAYELIVRRLPFEANSPQAVAMKHMAEPVSFPLDAPHVSAAMRAVLVRGLAKNREERFARAGEFAQALARTASSSETGATHAFATPSDALRSRPRAVRVGAWLASLALVVVSGVWAARAVWGEARISEQEPESESSPSTEPAVAPATPPGTPPARPAPSVWRQFSVAVGHDWSFESQRGCALGAKLDERVTAPLVAKLAGRPGIESAQRAGLLLDSNFSAGSDAAAIGLRAQRDLAVVLSYRWIDGRFEQPNRLIDDENRWSARPTISLAAHLVHGARVFPLVARELTTRDPVFTSAADEAVEAVLRERADEFVSLVASEVDAHVREALERGLESRFALLIDDPTREFEADLIELVTTLEGVVPGSLARQPDAEHRTQPGIVRLPAPEGVGDGRALELALELDDHFSLWSMRLRSDELALHAQLAKALDDGIGKSLERERYSFTTRRWQDLTLYLFKKRSAARSEDPRAPARPAPAGANAAWRPLVVTDNVLYPSFVLATANVDASALAGIPGLVAIRWPNAAPGSRMDVHAECPELLEPSDDAFEARPGEGGELYFPKLRFRYAELAKLRQSRPADLVFDVSIDGAPAERIVLGARVASINDCPFVWVVDLESAKPARLDWSWMFAAYVNEDHPLVDRIGKSAIDRGFIQAWTGYQMRKPEAVYDQALALWATFIQQGIHYSSVTDSATSSATRAVADQHVRFIDESWDNEQANCVDGSVLFASALQKFGIESALVLVPGHCLVAFSLDGSMDPKALLCIETTALGGSIPDSSLPPKEYVKRLVGGFDEALKAGSRHLKAALARNGDGEHLVIPISAARRAGVLPIPYSR